jgi:glucokinase
LTTRYLGIDVGGTNSKLTVLAAGDGQPDRPGGQPGGPPDPPRLLATATIPTGGGDPGEVVDRLAAAGARMVAAHGPVAAAGAGVPGLFDETSGQVVFLPNLPAAWTGHRVRDQLAGRLGVPVALLNDARAFTLAESRMGAAAGCSTVVCLTLGTGVGGGVVVDGRLRMGPHGRAGELGHQVIQLDGPPCGCGNRGCVEAFAAGAALCRLGGQPSPEAVFAAAAAGDERAAAAVRVTVGRLAVGIANLVTVLWPERVVVGGGVAAAGEGLFGPLRAAVAAAAPLVDPGAYEIVPAALGPAAGAIGAALWAKERTGG